ncbi:TPA: rRNA maturation RNase YbeY [Patescibacteria group bacterium]|nr:MAG: putative rRNA maturation factor [Parcubacteria group bacterium GW2011_GWD2_42_14]HCC04926.1 rRNA maturation RNase YbeY [Patescibacteria group bacterium]
MSTISISHTIRNPWDTAGFEEIVRHILGPRYSVSIVLIGDTVAKKLNKQYRNKTSPANILTFPLTKNEAEIFLNVAGIKREAHRFGFTPSQHGRFLLIHGCLHLKGHTHGSTMERAEERALKKFAIR